VNFRMVFVTSQRAFVCWVWFAVKHADFADFCTGVFVFQCSCVNGGGNEGFAVHNDVVFMLVGRWCYDTLGILLLNTGGLIWQICDKATEEIRACKCCEY
jgi:hypothetical protein